jgi:hypothetical protein
MAACGLGWTNTLGPVDTFIAITKTQCIPMDIINISPSMKMELRVLVKKDVLNIYSNSLIDF